mmetsp:Transcript_59623/g.172151  ORF Transcript_59623/g.172151 Transcript_59623/m.172151 type:complete len:90 (+) Transcript_59623:131-400(+)
MFRAFMRDLAVSMDPAVFEKLLERLVPLLALVITETIFSIAAVAHGLERKSCVRLMVENRIQINDFIIRNNAIWRSKGSQPAAGTRGWD